MKWEPPKRLPKDYCKLEQQLEAELNLPWQVVLGRDCAETRVGYGRIRVAELHVIEGVEGLGAELHVESFYSVEFLEEREVCAGETWATQVVIIGRPVAKMIGLRLAEVRLIEVGIQPLMNVAVQRSLRGRSALAACRENSRHSRFSTLSEVVRLSASRLSVDT